MPNKFDSIRPFDDSDIPVVLPKLFNNKEFINSLVEFKFSHWPKVCKPVLAFITRTYINRQVSKIQTLSRFQHLIEPYMNKMLANTTESLTITGLKDLDLSNPCLFVSNHRDIALDPAFVNWALHVNGQDTVRIAVGDNLLKKPWVADLIRLNKCFIVERSATDRRKKLAAAKLLSEYIKFSLHDEHQHVWIAQREGRAKDGNDVTNPAIISMLTLNKLKTEDFTDYVNSLRIVPVSISYEFDPCDISKAKELQQLELEGSYDKPDNEDVKSIVNGITGKKGRVHVHFSNVLAGQYENAKQVSENIDLAILKHYKPFATGPVAAHMLNELVASSVNRRVECSAIDLSDEKYHQAKEYLQGRVKALSGNEQIKLLTMYANAYLNQQAKLSEG